MAYWADFELDPEFIEEFQKNYSNKEIPEADDDDNGEVDETYLNMEVSLPRSDNGPEFSRITKRLRDANGLPIDLANENLIIDTRVYEIEYVDGHKDSIATN